MGAICQADKERRYVGGWGGCVCVKYRLKDGGEKDYSSLRTLNEPI